jgi:hypothetical protein
MNESFQETGRTGMAPSNRFLDFIRYGTRFWRRRALRRAFVNAQLDLGERKYAAGIDDGYLAAQISAWDEKIRESKAQNGSRQTVVAGRQRLLVHQELLLSLSKELLSIP